MLQSCLLELQKLIMHIQTLVRLSYMPLVYFYNLLHLLNVHQIAHVHPFAKYHVPNSTSHQCLMILTPWTFV
jgi:hypothetical protein